MHKIIGLGRKWVVARLDASDYQPELCRQSNKGRLDWCYSPECFNWLQREAETFQERYPLMGDFIPLPEAINELGRSRRWIHTTIAKHRLAKPQYRRNSSNRVTECISRGTLASLIRHDVDYAPGGWYNLSQLAVLSGWGRTYISNRLAEAGTESMICLGQTGSRYRFYAPEAHDVIGNRPKHYPPAGENFTECRMAKLLGRSQHWVRARLKMRNLTDTAEIMLDDWNRPSRHYTPMVFRTLKHISEGERPTTTNQDSRKVG